MSWYCCFFFLNCMKYFIFICSVVLLLGVSLCCVMLCYVICFYVLVINFWNSCGSFILEMFYLVCYCLDVWGYINEEKRWREKIMRRGFEVVSMWLWWYELCFIMYRFGKLVIGVFYVVLFWKILIICLREEILLVIEVVVSSEGIYWWMLSKGLLGFLDYR